MNLRRVLECGAGGAYGEHLCYTWIEDMKATLVLLARLGCLKAFKLENGESNRSPRLEPLEEFSQPEAHERVVEEVTDMSGRFPRGTTKSTAAGAMSDGERHNIELEKRKRRAERFGIPLADSAKAIERAKRFGENTTSTTEESKKEARGKKFKSQVWKKGGEKPAEATKPAVKKVLDDPLEAEKAKKRAERFGGGNEAKKVKT